MQISLSDLVLDQDAIDRLASGDTYFGPRTPFTDWQQAASDLARESEEEVAERAIELYSEVDPGRGRAMGGSTADLAFREIVQEPSAESWMEVYEREGLSPYKLDPETGEKFYINTPPGVNLVDLLEGEDKQEYLDLLQKQDFEVRASDRTYNVETGVGGIGAGDYGTVIRPPEVSGADRLTAIAAPLLASAMLGPLAGKLTAAAGATGATGTALTNALTGAASASLTGGDPVDAALIAGLGSLITPEISSVKEGVIETTTSPTSITSSEIPSDILSFQADIPDISTRGLLEGYTPFSDPLQAAILDPSVSTTFADPLRAAIAGKGDLAQYGTLEDIATARSAFTPELDIASPATLTPTGGLRENLTREGFSVTGPATSPDIFLELTTDVSPYEYTPSRREVTLREQDPRPVVQPPQPPTQTPGGGGGAPSAAASAPTTTTVTAPAAPSATITPSVQPPTFTAPGSVTSSLFSNFVPALAAAAVSEPAQQPTVAPPVTPVATTAPTPEPTPPTTTEPTDILEDTTVEDTTAQVEAEAQAQAEAQEAREAAEARAEADALAEAVAAGEALGEAQYGEGLGTGRGQGAGAGLGLGLGVGLLGQMLGQGTGVTLPDFEDYQFRKTYQAPELLELAPQYEAYQAPAAYDPQANYAQTIADEIRNLTSFPALSQDQVQNRLGLFNDALLQEAVMQNLYGAGGR